MVVPQQAVGAAAWDAVVVPRLEAAAWDAAEEPQQEAAAVQQREARGAAAVALLRGAVPDVRVVQRRAALPSAALWLLLGLRHNQRRSLRVRWSGGELQRSKSGRGKQHETKFCHDGLGPRKISGNKVWRSTNKR
jgi:hypothetical protein